MIEQASRIDTDRLLPLHGLHDMFYGLDTVKYDNIVINEKYFDYFIDTENEVGIKTIRSDASDHDPIYTYIRLK